MPDPVRRIHSIAHARPAEVYAVVVDFPSYPKFFPEIKNARVVSVNGLCTRVEFRAQLVLPARYVLDLICDPSALTITWTFVEGEIVSNSTGGWIFSADGDATRVDYQTSLDVQAPVPAFVLRKVLDGLVALSLPAMFTAIEKEIRLRRPPAP